MPFSNASVYLQTMIFIMNNTQPPTEYSSNNYYLNIGKAMNVSKCYGSFGCFDLSPPWTSEHRPVSLLPEESFKIEPHFPYLTRSRYLPPLPEFDLDDYDVIRSSNIDPNLPLYIITHGFMESGNKSWLHEMAHEFLRKEECTVIIIDWGHGSGPPYTQAVANIRLVSVIAAHLLGELGKYTGSKKLDHVHCVGHSLGAHLCGYIGYALKNDFKYTLGRITGMDPAEPHFAKAQPPVRLDRSAAYYVDVIHTDASAFIRGGLGMTEAVGHVDYFPNGGTNQPGCGKSVVEYISSERGSFIKGIRLYLGCNHLRSHEYFTASINPSCKNFMSIRCDSFEDFKNGKCLNCNQGGKHCITFGYHGKKDYQQLLKTNKVKPTESLIQYSLTGAHKPYCKAHYHITVTISDSSESRQHGGEIGQLLFKFHGSVSNAEVSSDKVPLNDGGYHEPGGVYKAVVPADEVPSIKSVEVEWNYDSNVFNPLTWRIFASPRIFVTEVSIKVLETQQHITVCPKDKKPLISGIEQTFLPSYCTVYNLI